jgi:hypothetical protein
VLAVNEQVFFSHFPVVSDALKQYAVDEPLSFSRYLFVRREKKVQVAYCTHCQREYAVEGVMHKHNEKTDCALCHSSVTVKSNGMGHKTLVDQAYIVWYEKSAVDPTLLVATWYLATRDYNGDYQTIETTFQPRARYLFEPNRGATMFRMWNRWNWQEKTSYEEWVEQKNISPMPIYTGGGFYAPRIDSFISLENVEQAVVDTYFAYLPWQSYSDWQASEENSFALIDFFALAAKYPSVEYLAKMGLKKVVAAKMHGQLTYGAVNWSGKTIEKVLKMDKRDLRELRDLTEHVTPLTLHSFHYWRKLGIGVDWRTAGKLEELVNKKFYGKRLGELSKVINVGEAGIVTYLLKQSNRDDAPERYNNITTVLGELRDYLHECEELGMDMKQEHVLFPNNLYAAHLNTMQRVKVKHDESLNQAIAERVAELERFAVENRQFMIRPAKDSVELFTEGKTLQHCVGGYADRYARGELEIYFVRVTDAPDVPFVTVEMRDGRLVQARGMKNSDPQEEVNTFLQDFLQHMKKVKQQLTKASRLSVAS